MSPEEGSAAAAVVASEPWGQVGFGRDRSIDGDQNLLELGGGGPMGVRVLTAAVLTVQRPCLGRPRRGGPGRASSLRPSLPRSGPASAVLAVAALAAHPRAGPSSSPRRPWSRSTGARSCCRASHALPRICRQATRAPPPEPPRVAGRGRENEERGATPRPPGFASEERGGAFLCRGWRPRQNAYPVCVFCWRRFAFPKSTVATHFWLCLPLLKLVLGDEKAPPDTYSI